MGLPRQDADILPTSQLLTYIHRQVEPTFMAMVSFATPAAPATKATRPLLTQAHPRIYGHLAGRRTEYLIGVVATGRWKSLLPGGANYEAFSIVGRCLFALLAGHLVGGDRPTVPEALRASRGGEPGGGGMSKDNPAIDRHASEVFPGEAKRGCTARMP